MFDEAVFGRRSDGRSRVGGQYKTTGHQLAAVDQETTHLRTVDPACATGLEHAARRQETGALSQLVI